MSPNKTKKDTVPVRESSPEAGPSSSKRPRCKISSDDEEEVVPKKAPSKYGSKFMRSPGFTAHNKPAELFRKDLISAMKLADSEPLQEGSYVLISDPWRQEWEKGVQVPVNTAEVMKTDVKEIRDKGKTGDFKMPHKILHERVDCTYKKGLHELTGMQQLAEQLVRYDLDDLDVCWLEEVNFRRREMGLVQINEWNMERVMEALENQCHEKMTALMKTEEGMGIEYDEDVVCDVCRSPESEDTNEMVFCDGCDVCIHQACYGIQSIPEGTWLCRTCALGIKPSCLLCPRVGGAMKSTRSGTKWAHVSCALWIPEVSIGIPEKMEPITKISNIPSSRWALVCCLCKERVGACIQCSVKTCKTAFHVTCGFSNGLEMKTILDESDEHDGVKLKAYCPKHTKKPDRGHSESDTDSPRKEGPRKEGPPSPKKELTQQERDNLRLKKLKSLEEEFYSVVDVAEVCQTLQLEEETVDLIFIYWKLKRKCNWDKPLLTPKTEEADILEKQQEDSLVARMKMFVHLRQDLERVRNLCYMIGKREKMKRQFFRSKEYVFTSMVHVLIDKTLSLANADVDDIVHNYRFDSIYDDYGSSVPNLPPEPSQDEEELVEKEPKAKVETELEGDAGRVEGATEEEAAASEDVDIEVEEEEDPSLALPPGERFSGEFERTGFFHRRRHKKWALGKAAKRKKLQAAASSSETSVLASASKREKVEDDSVFFASTDDTDDEKLASRVKAEASVKAGEGADGHPPIPKLVVKSPLGSDFHRHKKRHRGRKPWHVKKSHHYDNFRKIEFSTDEEEDMKVMPVVPEVKRGGEVSDKNITVDVEGGGAGGAGVSHYSMQTRLHSPKISVKTDPEESPAKSDRLHSPPDRSLKIKTRDDRTCQGSAKTKPDVVRTNTDAAAVESVSVKPESVHSAKREKGHKHRSHKKTSKRERRRSGHRTSKSKMEASDSNKANESFSPTVGDLESVETGSKETSSSVADVEKSTLPPTPKHSKLERKHRDRGGKCRTSKEKEKRGKEFESPDTSKDSSLMTDGHQPHRSRKSSERSNIFESFEPSHTQQSNESEEPHEAREPRKLPKSPDRHLASDWHLKLKNFMSEKTDSTRLSQSSKHPSSGDHHPSPGAQDTGDPHLGQGDSLSAPSETAGAGLHKRDSHKGEDSSVAVSDRHVRKISLKTEEPSEVSHRTESLERRRKSSHVEGAGDTSDVPQSGRHGGKSTKHDQSTLDVPGPEPVRHRRKSRHHTDDGGETSDVSQAERHGGKGSNHDKSALDCLSPEPVRHQRKSRHHMDDGGDTSDVSQTERCGGKGSNHDKSELDCLSPEPIRHRRKSRHHMDDGGDTSDVSQAERCGGKGSNQGESTLDGPSLEPLRHRRKSSHQARLKVSKVLNAPEESSDDDFEPPKAVAATVSRSRRHRRPSSKRRSGDPHLSEATEEEDEDHDNDDDDEEEDRRQRRNSRHTPRRECSQQQDVSEKSPTKTHTGGLRPELKKLLKPSDLIVEDDLIKRVENSFLKRYRHHGRSSLANGALDSKQRKIDAFFSKNSGRKLDSAGDNERAGDKSPQSKNRVLNEISPEKSGNFQNNLFGAHYSPRGSLTGYKIPKKNSTPTSSAGPPSSPQHNPPTSGGVFGMGKEFRSFRSEAAAAVSPRLRRREEKTGRRSGGSHAGDGSDVDTASVVSGDQCEVNQFSIDHCRGYRSQSPSSETSTAPHLHSDSRESTPRRFTRSQLADDMVENSPSPSHHGVCASSGAKSTRLRDSLLKASQFSS
ncbi:PHD finger protein rhinoceros-like isoform X2 [Littorina saxatilis]|uniref:Uncharacterized protein n=1 Tax=Littorina saxatilis TaxID=31220 RepID=A0AAN9B219_9CAEN